MMKKANTQEFTMTTRKQGGFALLEALVSLLIFSAGILGYVGMQANMIKAQSSFKYRTTAAMLANEITGLMWAAAPASRVNFISLDGAVCTLAACTQWLNKVSTTLPSGEASIAFDSATATTNITITWTQPNDGTHRYVASNAIF
jgi:type IV pilus assembly protein PilV